MNTEFILIILGIICTLFLGIDISHFNLGTAPFFIPLISCLFLWAIFYNKYLTILKKENFHYLSVIPLYIIIDYYNLFYNNVTLISYTTVFISLFALSFLTKIKQSIKVWMIYLLIILCLVTNFSIIIILTIAFYLKHKNYKNSYLLALNINLIIIIVKLLFKNEIVFPESISYEIIFVIFIFNLLIATFISLEKKHKLKDKMLYIPCVILALFSLKYNNDIKWQYHPFEAMGTYCSLKLFTSNDKMQESIHLAKKIIAKNNKIFSSYHADSELSRLNNQAYDKDFKCSNELYSLIKISQDLWLSSQKQFDITIEPAMKLWGLKYFAKDLLEEERKLPTKQEIETIKAITGFDKIILNDEAKTVRFKKQGMKINLGALAKGYILDQVYNKLSSINEIGIINLGGNIRTLNKPPLNKKYYEVIIKNPINNDVIQAKLLPSYAIASSGNYERFVIINNKRYCHIINPLTLFPVEYINSASVISKTGLMSDSLSTMLYLSPKNFLKEIDTPYLIIDSKQKNKIIYQPKKFWKIDSKIE